MPKNVPNALRLETLNGVINQLPVAKENFFVNLFGTTTAESDTVRWMSEYGSMGMTPFAAPGTPAAVTRDDDWWNEASARAAYYKEKRYFDESFLNNLADEMNPVKRKTAEQTLAKNMAKMNYRIDRRREWMMAQMFFKGGFSYTQEKGLKFTVDYGIPATHKVTLSGNYVWGTGTSRNPLGDVFDMTNLLRQDSGVSPEMAVCSTSLLKLLLFDDSLRALLQKSQFGEGDLFSRPAQVIGELLGVGPLKIYDDIYELRSHLITTAAATNTFTVEDVTDFEIGGTARLRDMSKPRAWEDLAITGVNFTNNTITTATSCTGTYRAGRDVVVCRKRFLDEYTLMMFASTAEGQKIAEFMEAPYGMNRRWGKFADTKDEWDPDGIWLRIQDKGLPVLYNPETIATIKVK